MKCRFTGADVCGHKICEDDYEGEEGFDFQGTWITDPHSSECGRFEVDPVQHYGQAYINWRDKSL